MSIEEFDIIQRYFSAISFHQEANAALSVAIGDDAAVLHRTLFTSADLVVCADTLCEGTHFFPSMDPFSLGIKALVVNVSDIASMGAVPMAFTLCLTLPLVDHAWLHGFSQGLSFAAKHYGVSLIGGDTTRGPLAVSIQIFGQSSHAPLRRSGAKAGDLVAVTGTLGDAGAGFAIAKNQELTKAKPSKDLFLLNRFHRPQARVGFSAVDGCHACIDISDGFLQDLEHICKASGLKAEIDPDALPLSPELQAYANSAESALHYGLIGGEDYELCLTFSPENRVNLEKKAATLGFKLTVVGEMFELDTQAYNQYICLKGWTDSALQTLRSNSFQHFLKTH